MIPPQSRQAIGIHDSEDHQLLIFPADKVLISGVGQELVHIIPEQPAV